MKNKPLYHRMQFALNGIAHGIAAEKSFRFQLMVAIAAICMLGLFQPPLHWWAIVFIMIGLVLFAELVNTAIEGLCDFIHPEYSEEIKKIKDVAAGAVLVLSICAMFVGLFFLIDMFVYQ